MRILLTGATGFVGRNLVSRLLQDQHSLVMVGRSVDKIRAVFGNTVKAIDWQGLTYLAADQFDAVINLAGENIAAGRWTKKCKMKITQSRIDATQRIVNFCLSSTGSRPHLYNASAIGIYGVHATERLVESAALAWCESQDFSSQVGRAWELPALAAMKQGMCVTVMRFAVVLKPDGGMLKKLLPSFKLGLGCVLGRGDQMLSWIASEDLTRAIAFLLQHPELVGPVNLCAPNAVTQRQFAAVLAKTLHRPLWLKLPAWLIHGLFGQMGDELLLGSQNIYPERLLAAGFHFSYPTITDALVNL